MEKFNRFISLRENRRQNDGLLKILYIFPMIAMVKQTMLSWYNVRNPPELPQTQYSILYLVCSCHMRASIAVEKPPSYTLLVC